MSASGAELKPTDRRAILWTHEIEDELRPPSQLAAVADEIVEALFDQCHTRLARPRVGHGEVRSRQTGVKQPARYRPAEMTAADDADPRGHES